MKKRYWTFGAEDFILGIVLVVLWGFTAGVTAMYYHFMP